MKKNIIIILITIFCTSISLYAQSNYSSTMLEGKDWYLLMPNEYPIKRPPQGVKYVNGTKVSFIYDGAKRVEATAPYYLSSTPDKTFDQSKVGKSTTGKYIIILYNDGIACSEILRLTSTELRVKNHWNNWVVGFSTTCPNK